MKRLSQVLVISGLIMMSISSLTSATDLSGSIIFDVPPEIMEKQFGKIPVSQLTRQDSIAVATYRYSGDTIKVLAILLEWTNRPGTYSKETFDSLLFSKNVFPGGSVADYFNEVSYDQLHITGEVKDWYNAGTYYGSFCFRALFPELDSIIDYSQFDGDNDGNVDAITVIRSGNGQEDTYDENDIWSYASNFAPGFEIGPLDGVYITCYNTCPETRPLHDSLYPPDFTGEDTLNSIVVYCHELAHNIGFPDLYDYDSRFDTTTFYTPNDYNDHPLSDWCLMGGQGGLLSDRTHIPSHLCGWSKKLMDWIEPVIVPSGTHDKVIIYNIETTKDSSLYMVPITPSEGEYFLLEYRNPSSSGMFDKLDSDFSFYFWPYLSFGGDSLDRGLLITHVHDSLGLSNRGTPKYPHYRITVEDAGYNPAKDTSYNPEGHVTDSAQWWYPYETRIAATFSSEVSGQELFSPTTTPNSDGYFGPSGIVVRVDSIVDDKLYAYIQLPIPAFSLLSPEDSAFGSLLLTFQWTNANPWEELKYDLHVSTSPAFHQDSTVIYDSILTTQYTDSLEPGRYYWKVKAYNASVARWSEESWTLLSFMYGDANADKQLSVTDAIYLINYLFKGGLEPAPLEAGDVNCDGEITVSDVIYLINYLFKGGPPPGC